MNQRTLLILLVPALVALLPGCQSEPPKLQIERGEQLLADGRHAEAISLFEDEIVAYPASANLHAWLARAYAGYSPRTAWIALCLNHSEVSPFPS